MNRLRHTLIGRTGALCAALALFWCATPVFAAQVKKVRVGTHEKFTRVVFELDESTGYRIERVGGDANPALVVTLDANTTAHALRSGGDIRTVKVDAGANAVARIALRKPGLRLQEMILANPPRIVLDVMKPEPPPAPVAKATPRPKAQPAAPEDRCARSRCEAHGEGRAEAAAEAGPRTDRARAEAGSEGRAEARAEAG